MKVILYIQYGPPELLQLAEVEKPIPDGHQVLVKVHAASVNAMEWRCFAANPLLVRLMGGGLLKPKNTALGRDIAGTVEAAGASVTRFQPGEAVFGVANGGFAEYACTSEANLALKPDHLSFEAAAAVPVAAFTALQGLRDKGHLRAGQKVLIHGASGGVGIFAVQLAKYFGAEVTAVCSTRSIDLVRSIGADHVIDYRREDFTRNGQRYDLIAAVNGSRSIFAYRAALSPNGVYVGLGGSMSQIFQGMLLGALLSKIGTKQMGVMLARTNQKDLAFLAELLEAGKIVPVIDQCYPLSETASAIRYVAEEHARGKVVISIVPSAFTPAGGR